MDYIILGFLFILSAFFSGSETAFTSVNKFRLESKSQNGDKKAKKVLKLIENPEKMLTTILIGNNFVNIFLTALATAIMIDKFGEGGVFYSTVILTVILLIFSEITPKSIAAVYSEKISYVAVLPITLFMKFLKPIVFLMSRFTNFIISALSKNIKEENTISSDDLKVLVNQGSKEGVFHTDETILITSVLEFKHKEAGDAMKTPRVDIVSISSISTFEEVREIIQKEQYSRYPVYEESTENIIGFFYAKDFVSWSANPKQSILEYIDKDVLFIPDGMPIETLFKEMQDRRKHLVMVVDEYGGISGLISLEDVIEVMIGHEINDEKDEQDIWIEEVDAKTMICNADVKLEKIESVSPIRFEEEADTLGEFILDFLGKIPKKGESFTYQSHQITIKQMEKHRIKKIEIKKK